MCVGCPDCHNHLPTLTITTRCSLCERLQGNSAAACADNITYKLSDNVGINDEGSVNRKRTQCQSFTRTMRTRSGDSRGASSVVRWPGHWNYYFNLTTVIIVILMIAFVNVTVGELNLPTIGKSINSDKNGGEYIFS